MASKPCKKISSFALEDRTTEQRAKKTKANTQIFFSASMISSKTAHVRGRSSSLLRQSIADSIERNMNTTTSLYQACRGGLIEVVAKHLGNPSTSVNNLDASGYAPLHYAARYQRTQITLMLITFGADVNVTSAFEHRCLTPLHVSVRSNALDVARVLIEKGANLDQRSVFGQHALHYGAWRANAQLNKLLLDSGSSPNLTDNEQFTPLHVAAVYGRLDIVQLLLLYGANPCQVDCDYYTAIEYAAKEGHVDILRELLRTASTAEVSFSDLPNSNRKDTNSSLFLAVQHGHVEAAKACIEYGADPSAAQDDLDTPLHVACKVGLVDMVILLLFHGAVIDAEDKDGMTPVLRASLAGKVDILDVLLNEGADVLPPPGSTTPAPLLCAVKRGHGEAVVFLLQRGSPIELRDTQYRTCLHIAVCTADIETVRVILKNGGDVLVDSRDKDDKIPMHYAAAKGDIEIIEELLQAGSRVDLKDEDEKLPLHYAAEDGHLECVQLLVKKLPSSVDSPDSRLRTPLNYAAIGAHSLVVRYLISKGADCDNRDDGHVTPLIHAAKCGCYVTVETLLDNGAHINATDKNKNTPVITAALHGHAAVTTMLLDRGADLSIVSLSDHNCLTAATASGKRNVCLAIVNHSRWEEVCQSKHGEGHPPIKALIESFPGVAKIVLDKCISHSEHQKNEENLEVTYRFDYLDPDPTSENYSRENKFFAPKYMLEGVHKDLLFHPLTLELVRYKWKCFGLRFFYIGAIVHLVFLLILTSYIMCINNSHLEKLLSAKNNTHFGTENLPHCYGNVTTWEAIVGIISVYNLIIEGYQMYVEKWNYIDTSNVVELATFSCSLVAVVMRSTKMNETEGSVYWSFTVIAVLFTYLTMLIQLQSLFQNGIYVTMLFEVLKTVIKVMVFFIIVFLVYALVFHLLLSRLHNRALLHLPFKNTTMKDPFVDLKMSFLKTVVMTIGEVEYTRFFVDEPLVMPDLAYIVFISFCLILPIALMNLMIGLAVGDIDTIQKNAELKRLAVQIDCIYEFEEKLPSFLLRRFHCGKIVEKPNKKQRTFFEKLKCKVSKRLFSTGSDKPSDDSFSMEEWTRMTESLDIKMQKQEERVHYLTKEITRQKKILERIFATATLTNNDYTSESL